MKMENQVEEMVYETPQVKMIVVEVEQGFAISDLENPGRNSSSEW